MEGRTAITCPVTISSKKSQREERGIGTWRSVSAFQQPETTVKEEIGEARRKRVVRRGREGGEGRIKSSWRDRAKRDGNGGRWDSLSLALSLSLFLFFSFFARAKWNEIYTPVNEERLPGESFYWGGDYLRRILR